MESAWQYFVQAVHREEVSFLKIDSRLHQLIPLNLKQLHTQQSQVIANRIFLSKVQIPIKFPLIWYIVGLCGPKIVRKISKKWAQSTFILLTP